MVSQNTSVLPSVLQNPRWQVLEQLLDRLNGLSSKAIIMLFDITPSAALDELADQFSLTGFDGWAFVQTDAERRALLKEAVTIHRYKGTPFAIKRTLKLLGFGDVELIEQVNAFRHDAQFKHDKTKVYGEAGSWTHYAIYRDPPIDQSEYAQIQAVLRDIAPLRCKLVYIDVSLKYDGHASFDGNYTYGSLQPS